VEIEKALKKKEALSLLKEITTALESDAAKTIKVADLTIELPKKIAFSLEYEVWTMMRRNLKSSLAGPPKKGAARESLRYSRALMTSGVST
jgi:hypothetical protein